MSEVTQYRMEALVPSWLASDAGYLAAFRQSMTNRMHLHGYDIVDGPSVRRLDDPTAAPGLMLLEVRCDVVEFDIVVPDDVPVPTTVPTPPPW